MIAFYDSDIEQLTFDLKAPHDGETEHFKFTVRRADFIVDRYIFTFYRPAEDGQLGSKVFEAVSGFEIKTSKRMTYAALCLLKRRFPMLIDESYIKTYEDKPTENYYHEGGTIQ